MSEAKARRLEIIPAIVARTPLEFQEATSRVDGLCDWLHIDIADGKFADNRTIVPEDLNGLILESMLEFHLLAAEPAKWIERLRGLNAGRIIMPVEVDSDIRSLADAVHRGGAEFGLSINLETPVEKLTPYLDCCDHVLVFAIEPGYQGQVFRSETLSKLASLQEIAPDLSVILDGGVNPEVIPKILGLGVNSVVVGAYLQRAESQAEALEDLEEAMGQTP